MASVYHHQIFATVPFGRPSALNEEQKITVISRIDAGGSISAIAREFDTTRQTILRVKTGKHSSKM